MAVCGLSGAAQNAPVDRGVLAGCSLRLTRTRIDAFHLPVPGTRARNFRPAISRMFCSELGSGAETP